MPIDAKNWYEPKPDLTSFYQGDVAKDIPIVFLPDKISQWFLLRPNLSGAKILDDVLAGEMPKWFEAFPEGASALPDKWQHGEREEFVAAKARLMNIIIVTQSCDLANRSYYQVAPIYPETKQKENSRPHLRENNLRFCFFLPAFAPTISENSYADLSQIGFVPKRYFPGNQVKEKLIARLTSSARTKLQEQVAEYFGRPFGFSERDKAKATAEHACIDCFYSRALITKKIFSEGTNFTKCEVCGNNRWLRIRKPDKDASQTNEPTIIERT